MNRNEALKFLDLPGDASDIQFKNRLAEKLEHYERLSEKAPSAFLRKLNTLHLIQARLIQKDILLFKPEPVTIQSVGEQTGLNAVQGNTVRLIHTTPVIVSAPSKAPAKTTEEDKPVAFLVRHTENLSVKPFPLYVGKNFIGRKLHPTIKPFIAIEDDEYVSRLHAMIYADENNPGGSYIEDSVSSNEGKPSKNGTFLNGNKERLKAPAVLKENDTIQIGETKFIFKLNTMHIHKIVEAVQDSDYMHTVVIRR